MQASDRDEYERMKRAASQTGSSQLDEVSFAVVSTPFERDLTVFKRHFNGILTGFQRDFRSLLPS